MKNSKIQSIKAREILDSRGYPTVEVELTTETSIFVASVPSGTSTGKYEAKELRDGETRYQGMGVSRAIRNIKEIIAPKLQGKDPREQEEIDKLMIELDGTKDKKNLGANAVLAVSLAVFRAGAAARELALWKWVSEIAKTKPCLPSPCLLYVEGGLHGRGDIDTQEFMGFVQADSFKKQLQTGTEIYHNLRGVLRKKLGKGASNVGLEGGFTPPVQETRDILDLIMKAAGKKMKIILDMAATTFFRDEKYYFEGEMWEKKDLLNFYSEILREYPIEAMEDPFAQEDFESFQAVTKKFGKDLIILGDDLLATNLQRMKKAMEKNACNGLILKPNQIGTVTETIEAAKYALDNGWHVFVKHRSGETSDTFIADLATGLGNRWLMAGAPNRGERVAKYNRLLRIEEEF